MLTFCFGVFTLHVAPPPSQVDPELFVDTSRNEKMRINIDVVFPKMPCSYLSIDVMDISGEQQLDVMHTL